MIKVLNIISDTNIGGAGRVLLNYAKYRDREKFDMSVILPSGSMLTQPLRQLSAEVYEIDAMADRSFDREAVGMLKELIRKIDPDIVHTHGSLSGRIAARACGKKIVYTRHCGTLGESTAEPSLCGPDYRGGTDDEGKSRGERNLRKIYRYDDERFRADPASGERGTQRTAGFLRI